MKKETSSWSTQKSDIQLVEMLRAADQAEIDLALRVFQDRYQPKIERYLSYRLPYDWIPDVTQEIWIDFYTYVRVNEVRIGVSSVLWGIVRNKCADAVNQLTRERQIEYDSPAKERITDAEMAAVEMPVEELIVNKEQLEFLRQIPFSRSLLSDCERMLWTLRYNMGYSPSVVARLTGKEKQNVYSALSQAIKRVKDFLSSDDYLLTVAGGELSRAELARHVSNSLAATQKAQRRTSAWSKILGTVELTTNPLKPKLTPDELNYIGLTTQEFQTNFIACTMLIENYPPAEEQQARAFLLLVEQPEWELWSAKWELWSALEQEQRWISLEPGAWRVAVDVENENMTLRSSGCIDSFVVGTVNSDSDPQHSQFDLRYSVNIDADLNFDRVPHYGFYLRTHSPRTQVPIFLPLSPAPLRYLVRIPVPYLATGEIKWLYETNIMGVPCS